MSMLEDRSSYINISESAKDTDVGLGEADSETSPKKMSMRKILRLVDDLWGKLKSKTLHTTMVPEQVKT
ncbi:hypothetical protein Tco_0915257 [Tanacetum coccineum]